MKYNKLKAFTLAEVMVLLLTLSILLAAFAPVFTRRYNSTTSDEVWAFVPGSDENDAYYDVVNKTFTAQAFIGLTPANKGDVSKMSSNLYSKLIVAASKDVKTSGGSKAQNQIQFRYGNSAAGDLVGSLFAGNSNMLVGGPYKSITNDAINNTSYGEGSMTNLTSGNDNTGLGYHSLFQMTAGKGNTAIGYKSGTNISTGIGNTFVGNYAGDSVGKNVQYNTVIGNYAGQNMTGSKNTAIGNNALTKTSGTMNTAVGNNALNVLAAGDYNTAVGYNSMKSLTSGNNNTAIGDNSCLLLTSGSNKTCIGSFSGSNSDGEEASKQPWSSLFSNTDERVFIGSMPIETVGNSNNPGAVLEVHNVSGALTKSSPISNVGNASVMINGNLIVRGQPYLETVIRRTASWEVADTQAVKGLVLHQVGQVTNRRKKEGIKYGFYGYDGIQRTAASYQGCRGCKRHDYKDVRSNCICTAVSSDNCPATRFDKGKYGVSQSYDWTSAAGNQNSTTTCEADTSYVDKSYKCTVALEHRPQAGTAYNGTDRPLAHLGNSCCPDLTATSDIRLKNVGEKFTAGLDEIRKINVYNYTFKTDKNKLPQVGVIAQDLKMVFPNAVTKDENGYYKIRWDEMLYAAINAVKTLNTKVEKLAIRITGDKNRVAELKKDNAELNAQLDKLAEELTVLEAKRK